MPVLHAALRQPSAAPAVAIAPSDARAVVTGLDAFAEHVQDAIDMLGTRAAGLSLASAARHLRALLPGLSQLTRRDGDGTDPMPPRIRASRGQLRSADLALEELSIAALSLIPTTTGDQGALDLQLCRWADAARLLAAWIEARRSHG